MALVFLWGSLVWLTCRTRWADVSNNAPSFYAEIQAYQHLLLLITRTLSPELRFFLRFRVAILSVNYCQKINWWSRRESNPRPPECHSGALPTELRPRLHPISYLFFSKSQVCLEQTPWLQAVMQTAKPQPTFDLLLLRLRRRYVPFLQVQPEERHPIAFPGRRNHVLLP